MGVDKTLELSVDHSLGPLTIREPGSSSINPSQVVEIPVAPVNTKEHVAGNVGKADAIAPVQGSNLQVSTAEPRNLENQTGTKTQSGKELVLQTSNSPSEAVRDLELPVDGTGQLQQLVDGAFTDPDSAGEEDFTSNSFAALQHLSIDGGKIAQLADDVRLLSSPMTSPRLSKADLPRRCSLDNLPETAVPMQELKDFQAQFHGRVQGSKLLDKDCPRSALLDEKDFALLNRLLEKEKEKEEAKKTTRKPGRPRKTKDSQVVQQQSQAKYSLRSHAQSN